MDHSRTDYPTHINPNLVNKNGYTVAKNKLLQKVEEKMVDVFWFHTGQVQRSPVTDPDKLGLFCLVF